jgi:hypothetical protein
MVLLASAACGADEVFPVAHKEPLTVLVLDGNGGRPQARVHVVLVAGYDRHDLGLGLWREEAVTDGEGKVRLSDALRNLPLLRVEVLKRPACSAGTDKAAFSVERIRRDGLSGANRCGTATVDDAPGVFTVFVKGKKIDASKSEAQGPAGSARAVPHETIEAAGQVISVPAAKKPAPVPPLSDAEVAEMLLEQN